MNHLHDESTGGPAFPTMEVRTADTQDLVANASQGMTLRDWFAGQALAGIFASNANGATYEHICEGAYKAADAMLAGRNKQSVPAIPAGYKLVPIEPTQAMIDATQMLLVGARDDQGEKHGLYGSEARDIYKLMVGAFHASK